MSIYFEKNDPWSSHSLIASRLRKMPAGTKIIDIGSGRGVLGKKCATSGLLFYGIEPDIESAEISRDYYEEIFVFSVSDIQDSFLSGYDVVIFADILEHLPNPLMELHRIVNLQQPGAIFIISVPNVANIWTRFHLLMGNWDYSEKGILDKTHLVFFTQKTLEKMVQDSGLIIISIRGTCIPFPQIHPFFENNAMGQAIHRFFGWCSNIFPTLLNYQFIIEGVKPVNE